MSKYSLPQKTESLLRKIGSLGFIRNFYLTGGTALALQIGHRESDDLDFFTQSNFQPEQIQKELEEVGTLENVEVESGTLNCFMGSVKLQFLFYPYLLIEPLIPWKNIHISSKLDIACTKIITISARGSKKDFIDIYFLLKEYNLPTLFEKLKEKYPKTNYNEPHLLKSLVYFADADNQPSPRMHKQVNWIQVKEEIVNTIKKFEL